MSAILVYAQPSNGSSLSFSLSLTPLMSLPLSSPTSLETLSTLYLLYLLRGPIGSLGVEDEYPSSHGRQLRQLTTTKCLRRKAKKKSKCKMRNSAWFSFFVPGYEVANMSRRFLALFLDEFHCPSLVHSSTSLPPPCARRRGRKKRIYMYYGFATCYVSTQKTQRARELIVPYGIPHAQDRKSVV